MPRTALVASLAGMPKLAYGTPLGAVLTVLLRRQSQSTTSQICTDEVPVQHVLLAHLHGPHSLAKIKATLQGKQRLHLHLATNRPPEPQPTEQAVGHRLLAPQAHACEVEAARAARARPVARTTLKAAKSCHM